MHHLQGEGGCGGAGEGESMIAIYLIIALLMEALPMILGVLFIGSLVFLVGLLVIKGLEE